LADKALIAPLQ